MVRPGAATPGLGPIPCARRNRPVPQITCPCGKEFYARPSRIASGGGKYCSSSCYGEFADFRSRARTGVANPAWKGDRVSYRGLHHWIYAQRGAPTACEKCGTTEGKFEWANISQEYRRDLADWMALCLSCHRNYDAQTCRRGHERNSRNAWIDKEGKAHCRVCTNERLRMQRAGKHAEWKRLRDVDRAANRKSPGAPASI